MINKRKIINDPVYGFLSIDDDIIYDIISHPWFQRQRHIKQLGFTYLVYPGATHSRFSHMLGALNLIKRAISVLQAKGVAISQDEALGVQLAILLHDIGHGPFSHTSEHALCSVHHEQITLLFMQRLNCQFDHRLDTAIAIFNDTYPRHFLHQLVSSQLDMDRLDYLARDSFFTGVSEGIVGTERIINMLNVHNDTLVVDEKGIYSVEKFIIARRLMYWQVYLHKTVIAADNLFYSILRRVRTLIAEGRQISGNRDLLWFLTKQADQSFFDSNPDTLVRFAQLDDSDIMSTIKEWMHSDDQILSSLSVDLVNRHLPLVTVSPEPPSAGLVEELIAQHGDYFVSSGQLVNHAYSFDDSRIQVLFKNGRCLDISQASDQLDRHFLEKTVTKYYICRPKQ